jgi:hypothetical protein
LAFTGAHVNALQRMVARHYAKPHRFICVTNDATGIDSSVEIVPDRADFADVPNPHGGRMPSCYRRLRAFAPDAAENFGDRFVSLDLDVVATGDLVPLWDRLEDFVGWHDPYYPQFCGSMFLLRAGSRPEVWTNFDPIVSPLEAKARGFMGSDQAWISRCLWRPDAPQWRAEDGVLSYRIDVERRGGRLTAGARIVFFHGKHDPWNADPQRLPWVREHWGTA